MSFDFPQPLRLAVGSHQAGSGRGCAMNVISYENGDTVITDFPECADDLLSVAVQAVNDTICKERDGALLCSDCSIKVLELAHRTVGTRLDMAPISVRALRAELLAWLTSMFVDDGWTLPLLEMRRAFTPILGGAKTIEDAHRLIDKFEELTGIKAKPVPAEVTEQAVTKMREKVDA